MRTSWFRDDNRVRGGLLATTYPDKQCCTERARDDSKNAWTAALLATVLVAAGGEAPAWPPFLPPRETFPPDLAASVEHVWTDATLTRRVEGRPAAVPFETYVGFVDAPDVTAAAARFLKISRSEVRWLGGDWYGADDQDGSQGVYRVLVSESHRRVMLSWGRHTGRFLGTIGGSALTVIDFRERDGRVDQSLATWVRIDNAVAAALARLLLPIFGHLADRKLTEGFTISGRVAEWALARPDEFCAWLAREPLPAEHVRRVRQGLPACRDGVAPQAARRGIR